MKLLAPCLILLACSGSQPVSSEERPSDLATARARATDEPTTHGAPSATATAAATAVASASAVHGDHAPGGSKCNELAKVCHDVGHGADELGTCHEIGHAGDSGACEKEHARCVALCTKAARPGGHDHGKHKHAP